MHLAEYIRFVWEAEQKLLIAENVIQIILIHSFSSWSMAIHSQEFNSWCTLWRRSFLIQTHGMSQSLTKQARANVHSISAVKYVVKLLEAAIFLIVMSMLVWVLLFSVAARDRHEDRWIKASVWNSSSQSYLFWRFGLQRMNKIDPFVIMLRFFGVFYGSIVSHSMSEKTRQTK